MHPSDALLSIFFLLLLQDKFDEQLLQLLVTVVDAELLKAAKETTVSSISKVKSRKVR